ncbi:HamA C-terminal domain-containing protein [Sphingopyxis sp.]|uniref:HamA C-terminal domain-containing protein n=1 Tax=Sphingopyxis sp. TaxID=1908224 RepID=UPI002ED95B7E
MTDGTSASDAGGIAARRGFRIQDHVAARLALDMLVSPDLVQLECETGDDIVLRWEEPAGSLIEYVQVKTTDGDSKWSFTELTAREASRKGSSVAEKSLDRDRHGESAAFRLVTTRDARADLRLFQTARALREPGDAAFGKAVQRFVDKYKDAMSPSGRSLGEWAGALLWEVEADEAALRARNINRLIALANGQGVSPSLESAEAVYRKLLEHVGDMADAPAAAPAAKMWGRAAALAWWSGQMESVQAANIGSLKVYRVGTDRFFSELSQIDESDLRRTLHAYDVEYDGESWRLGELVEHLLGWLPEVAIPGSLLATYDHLAARRLPGEAVRRLEQHGRVDVPRLISELMLHAILRHHFDAEPIACKLFYHVGGQLRSTNAHIVQAPGGDRLWLGRSRLVTATEHQEVVANVLAELRGALSREIVKAEREIIVQLREPKHLRSDTLGPILASNGKIADLLAVLTLPILVAYDSAVLGEGYSDDYVAQLQTEVAAEYARLKAELGTELDERQIAIFLVPVECAATLAGEFDRRLRQ